MMRNLVCLWLFLLASPALAITVEQPLNNHTHEAVAQEVIHALRCVVCEGQPLAESDATHAIDMRQSIRAQAAKGKTAQAITDYFVARYGHAILLRPPTNHGGLMLWLLPLIVVFIGILTLRSVFRKPAP
jgi:cytochrome c-type biogenesis protein CcmH